MQCNLFLHTLASEEDSEDQLVVCIDPGHGGDNQGALWNDYVEKDITMITAEAMRDELLKYEGIKVVMTREEDIDLSLEDRVRIASEAGADFFFCIHYNMSAGHDMYGAECWISAFGENYARGMDFARIEMEELLSLGLYDRGVKTRLNSKGTNYYGVLRVADIEGLPGVIIEHCHLDNIEDEPFYDHDEKLKIFGRVDATAVAKYYGLRSEKLNTDYSGYSYEPTPVPTSVVKPDSTPPELVEASFGDILLNDETGEYEIEVSLMSHDPDSTPLYYSYSTDGGAHFTGRYRWMNDFGDNAGVKVTDERISIRIPAPASKDEYVVFRAYNLFNLETDSVSYFLPKMDTPEEIGRTEPAGEEYEELEREEQNLLERADLSGTGFFLILACLILLLLVLFVILVRLVSAALRHY